MKKLWKKLLCYTLTICMCSSFSFANAAVTSSNYLDSYCAAVTPIGRGKIVITVDVNAIVDATEIGASRIYLYESSNGVDFTCTEEFFPEDYPLMLGSGYHHCKDAITYQGTVGYSYYANVYCYAGDSTGSHERVYSTAIVTAY